MSLCEVRLYYGIFEFTVLLVFHQMLIGFQISICGADISVTPGKRLWEIPVFVAFLEERTFFLGFMKQDFIIA